ncbi:uncharacterized protein VICG_01452 [Vittaforma corneae ATCC 50505]|uniref:Ribosomal protein L14e domain-containing protein n=1 Tax=Vittaforma corneae (strain ATCC 50505) TaxID=993615 RepID=L2GKQ6_VITCO|nr:uncharacterized protein VICG_01452 [Vittaforma corneae ATCC 50505]ELA41468.1 hypothetical protein VICG_01452 [Vittaforma corneae ATCC 50505]
MLFVELGREVSPRSLKLRSVKAVITGIKDEKFVVIQKQDRSFEVVRLKDIVLNDKVYDLNELKDPNHEFFKQVETAKKCNDFDRFKMDLEKRVIEELIKAKGIDN